MVPDDIVKEVMQIAIGADISEDVVMLLECKAMQLAREVELLEQQKAVLAVKNHELEAENKMLKGQLHTKTDGKGNELDPMTWDILKYFFHKGTDISDLEISQHFSLNIKSASYHTELLLKKKLIEVTTEEIQTWHGNCPPLFTIVEAGRSFIKSNPAPARVKV